MIGVGEVIGFFIGAFVGRYFEEIIRATQRIRGDLSKAQKSIRRSQNNINKKLQR